MIKPMREQVSARQRGLVRVLGGTLGVLILVGMAGRADAEPAGANGKPVVDSAIANYVPVGGVSGHLTVAGSDTMQPLMAKLAGEFTKYHPDVKLTVEGGGSSDAIREFVLGYSRQRRGEKVRDGHDGATKANILASSRELTREEVRAFASTNGYEPLMIPIAMDAVAIYVHADNPVQGLTMKQVDAIFGASRKRGLAENVTTWGQLGVTNGWEQRLIHLYGRDKRSGTRDFFMRVALLDGELKEEIREMPGTASEVLAIARDPSGIGYAGVGIESSYVRAVPLAEQDGQPFIKPGAESVKDGTYPLHRALYLYVNKPPKGDLDPVIAAFLKVINSREGQETVIKARFYPLSSDQVAENLGAITSGTATAFLPNSGN